MTDNNHPSPLVTIYIDAEPYEIRAGQHSVQQLRKLPNPDVSADKDLWLDLLDEQDRRLDANEVLTVTAGMRFFTENPEITIKIDRLDYPVYVRKMTGAQLRVVPSPDVAVDRDLWQDVPDKRDVKVQDEDVIKLHEGIRFFTAPGRINPGRPDGERK